MGPQVGYDRGMTPIRNVTVYLASSRHVPPVFFAAAAELGTALAARGWGLVYGGNSIGPMGALADAVRDAEGKVIGITPRILVDHGIADEACDELVVTDSMRQRKQLLEQRGDAFIALPGGLGTFEELFEIIVGRLLGTHDKPIVLLNIAGYYNPLLAMIEHGIQHGFIKDKSRALWQVCSTVPEAMHYLERISEAQSDSQAG